MRVGPGLLPNARQNISRVFDSVDMPRKSIPNRSRENGLRDAVKAGVTGVFCTRQTQLSISGNLPAAGFPAWAGINPFVSSCANSTGVMPPRRLPRWMVLNGRLLLL